ncbi:hypothetical protein SAMN04487934_10321, partial [Eubacterium ruminantium]
MSTEGKDKNVTVDIDDAIDNIFEVKKTSDENKISEISLLDPLGEAGTTVLSAEMLEFENDKPEPPKNPVDGFVSADAPKAAPAGQMPQGGPRPNGPMNGPQGA